jgi:hypothetical protein
MVVTETVSDAGLEPFSVTELEDREQAEPAGEPLHVRATA